MGDPQRKAAHTTGDPCRMRTPSHRAPGISAEENRSASFFLDTILQSFPALFLQKVGLLKEWLYAAANLCSYCPSWDTESSNSKV